jgi:hypothetical protein
MQKAFVATVAAAVTLLTFASANSAEAKDSPPASGGYDALYQWCRRTIIAQHGWSEQKPGKPRRMVMPAMEGTLMIDDCMRSHSAIH